MLREIVKVPTHTESTHEKSLLQPEAPLFTLLGNEATTTPTAACGGMEGAGQGTCATKAATQRAPPYDGHSTWEAYRTQFKILARVNGWNEMDKATYLAVRLKGPAMTVLSNVPRDSLYNLSTPLQMEICVLRMRQISSHPKSLCEALQTALELEAFQLASQQRAKPVRSVLIEEEKRRQQ